MRSRSSRRDFLKQAALGAGTLATGLAAGLTLPESATRVNAAEETAVTSDPALPIIDTHQHLWDLTRFRLPWSKAKGLEVLDRSYVMDDYLAATRGLNVVKAVYMEVDVTPEQQVLEAEYITAICKAGTFPTAAAVISGRPASGEFKDYITQFAENKFIKGVRQVLHGESTPAGYCLDSQFVKGVQLLGELGKSFDLCMRAGELGDAVKLVDQCPKTRFILDHCGNLSVQSTDAALRATWLKGLTELARRENVVCKISGIVASAKPGAWTAADLAPNINDTVAAFGKDRIMFGGDWPVCTLAATYAAWVDALKTIVKDWSLADQRKLFHDNAAKFYGLS